MIKRAVIRRPARGYVDGRFIGEEKDGADGRRGGRRKGNANADSILGSVTRAGPRGKRRGGGAGACPPRNIRHTTAQKPGSRAPRGGPTAGERPGQGQR